jgi:pyroglutamyl-peptidase
MLCTGFEPFGGSDDNPSMRLVERLAARPPAGVDLRTSVLPVTWAGSWPAMRALIDGHEPDIVIAMGQSGRRPGVTVERFGLNFAEGRIADNAGVVLEPRALVDGGPPAYASSVDVEACIAAMRSAGVPAAGSHNAGACVCNAVLYGALHHAHTRSPRFLAGFFHIPMMPGQGGAGPEEPTLELDASERAVRAALAVLAR